MVKYSFLDEKIVYQSFYGAPLTFSYFFFKEKLCVSAHVSKSRACLDRVYFVSKKLSFSCVCSMKMGLLKHVSPDLFDKKTGKLLI